MADLNQRQQRVLDLLRARRDRELYEGAAPGRRDVGSGEFWVTYSADEKYIPLKLAEVREMESAGLIIEKWPGCYELAQEKSHD